MLAVVFLRPDDLDGKFGARRVNSLFLNCPKREFTRLAPNFLFNLRRNCRCRAAAEVCLDFESVKYRRIVTGRNHDAAGEFAPSDFKRYIRRRIGTVHHHAPKTVTGKYLGRRLCELRGLEAHVKADKNGALGLLERFEVLGRGLSGIPDILKSKRIGNDASPTVGAKFDWNVHFGYSCE